MPLSIFNSTFTSDLRPHKHYMSHVSIGLAYGGMKHGKFKNQKKNQKFASLTQSFFLFQVSLTTRHITLNLVVRIVLVMRWSGASDRVLSSSSRGNMVVR